MITFFRKHPWSLGALAVAIAGLAWLAFGFFGVQTLFIDDEVSEALPTFDATSAQPAAVTEPIVPATTEPIDEAVVSEAAAEPAATQPPTTQPVVTQPAAAEQADTEIVTEYSGSFESDAHPTSGTAVVLGNGTDQRFLRFQEFETDNGPDLNVYLVNSSTGDVSDFVDLGDLKGNIGEQNYEIPPGIDLDVYDEVVIWCVRFGVGFGDALLQVA